MADFEGGRGVRKGIRRREEPEHLEGRMAALKEKKNPSFCKFFLPGVTDQYLRIPPAFLKHINHGAHQTISMKGPSGNMWHLHLVKDDKGFLFQDGWKEFARENCLEVGYFLVFRYDGNSCFTLQVFDTSGCDTDDLFFAKSCKESSSISVEEAASPFVSQFKGTSVYDKQSGQQTRRRRPIGLRRHVTRSSRMSEQNQPAIWDLENERWVESVKRRRMSTYFKFQLNPSESSQAKQKHKTVLKLPRGSLISQRRNVTGEERMRAVDKAKCLKLQNPSVVVVMRAAYVYRRFLMALPTKFAASYLPQENFLMTVWDPTGRKWKINYIGHNNVSFLSAGWKYFSLHNNLEEGDVCVFECVKKHELRVHIFRVVKEIAPLINNVVQKGK